MSEDTEKTNVKLPCECEFDDEAARRAVAVWNQNDLGMRILQCSKCKLIIGVEVFQPKIMTPFGGKKKVVLA